jgi:tungstate transport system substrate-binding protein
MRHQAYKRGFSILLSLLVLFTEVSVFGQDRRPNSLILATTSIQDSGLLEVLIPLFQRDTGYFVKTIVVGSGQAMKLGERREADVLLVHSPEEEQAFMIQGFGISRRLVMYNDFILVGPAHDPAQVKGLKTVSVAFKAIARTGALFLSRGDNSSLSGTFCLLGIQGISFKNKKAGPFPTLPEDVF